MPGEPADGHPGLAGQEEERDRDQQQRQHVREAGTASATAPGRTSVIVKIASVRDPDGDQQVAGRQAREDRRSDENRRLLEPEIGEQGQGDAARRR